MDVGDGTADVMRCQGDIVHNGISPIVFSSISSVRSEVSLFNLRSIQEPTDLFLKLFEELCYVCRWN